MRPSNGIHGVLVCLAAWIPVLSSACSSPQPSAGPPVPSPPYQIAYPKGLTADGAVLPPDNPPTIAKLRLGKRLYFDKRLSKDGSVSCATCHDPAHGFSDPERFSTGIAGKKGDRHSPPVINRLFSAAQFWDGRAASLEEQALMPVQNPVEMGMVDLEPVLQLLRADPQYLALFREAFPPEGAVSKETLGRALASFERTILSGNSPYDRFAAGDRTALSESAQRGLRLFRDEGKGDCETCHSGPNFTDENYYNIGVGMAVPKPDLGRYKVTGIEGHQGAFKTPTLREVAGRSPYMHDGSQSTLAEVVSFYVRGGHPNRWLSTKIKPLKLTAGEQADLVEFLKSLSGDVSWYGMNEP